jgi:hypothetical protein
MTEKISNLYFVVIAILIEISAVFFVRQLQFETVLLGTNLFITALVIQLLEIIQPKNLMKWIPFWTNTIGRGCVLSFLSIVAIKGFFFTGLLALIMSATILGSRIITGNYNAPSPLLDYEGSKTYSSIGASVVDIELK